jgi:hypothetical protein
VIAPALTGEAPALRSAAARERIDHVRPRAAVGHGGEPPPRQRMGPWVPAIPLILVPFEAGGDMPPLSNAKLKRTAAPPLSFFYVSQTRRLATRETGKCA